VPTLDGVVNTCCVRTWVRPSRESWATLMVVFPYATYRESSLSTSSPAS
jgi:hypothetical protein